MSQQPLAEGVDVAGRVAEKSDIIKGVTSLPGELKTGIFLNAGTFAALFGTLSAIIATVLLSLMDAGTTASNYLTSSKHASAHIAGLVLAGVAVLLFILAFFLYRRGTKCDPKEE